MKLTAVGIDIAKNVLQVHYVDVETGKIVNKLKAKIIMKNAIANG